MTDLKAKLYRNSSSGKLIAEEIKERSVVSDELQRDISIISDDYSDSRGVKIMRKELNAIRQELSVKLEVKYVPLDLVFELLQEYITEHKVVEPVSTEKAVGL